MSLPAWPPKLSAERYASLRDLATDWALAHGLVLRALSPQPSSSDNRNTSSNNNKSQSDPSHPEKKPTTIISSSSVVHAPFALFPTPFPRKCYERAVEIQPLFNRLVHLVANDHDFLVTICEKLAKVDEFTGRLYEIYKKVRDEGISQTIELGIHRSDYLLHYSENSEPVIHQVEINTIASSFACLSALTGKLHKYLLKKTDFFNQFDSPSHQITSSALPTNSSISGLAEGISKAHELYGVPNAIVLMVVQSGERNAFDQRWLEYELLDKHGVRLFRRTLAEINKMCFIDPSSKSLKLNNLTGVEEVSVTYYRAGYGPNDYYGEEEWGARLLVERSKSIKCPTVAYQLAGTKKVQQVLANPGVLERYVSPEDTANLRKSFTSLYSLDDSPEGNQAAEMAMRNPHKYVLKPQREGGGNNIYGEEVVRNLKEMTPKQREAFILMELIKPPPVQNILVREGECLDLDVISELGIYGIWVSQGQNVHLNKPAGHLLRTKSSKTNEGGVAAGFAVIDSPLLI